MRDHGNACVHRALEHGLKSFWRHGHDRKRIDALRNHVFDQGRLLLRICLRRPDLISIVAGLFGKLLHAFFHAVEPLNSGDFHHRGNLLVSTVARGEG